MQLEERLSASSQACLGRYPRKKALWGTFKQLCNLRDGLVGFHKAGNLTSFNMVEVFVFHMQLRLVGLKALYAIHLQPTYPQLIKVGLSS
jgi:hypothetical protein